MPEPRTLSQKIWDDHVVFQGDGEPELLFIDLHLVHEVTSPQAFDGLRLNGRTGILASHLNFGDHRRGWDFRSPGRGTVNFEEIIRELNRIGYQGPLSVEWEDSGMDREFGAREACAFVKQKDFAASARAAWPPPSRGQVL